MVTPRNAVNHARTLINAFVAQHQLAWDLTMAALALIYVGLIPFEDATSPHPGPLTERNVALVEVLITAVFLAEFALRFYAAESRKIYLRRHWIDLAALLPAVRVLRFLRIGRLVYLLELARFLRLGVLVRLLTELQRASSRIGWIARENGVPTFVSIAIGITTVGGALVWELEHSTNVEFHSFGNALWWAFATMTTVGYGTGPESPWGRVVAAIIMVVGIGCFGLMSATVTTLFVERTHKLDTPTEELKVLLLGLHERLDKLEGELATARAQANGVTVTGEGGEGAEVQ
ncbi:MAG TPA: ion transporter [Ktedonobacterales bacterium]